jgi:hypothetical protein
VKCVLLVLLASCNANDGGANAAGTPQVPALKKGSAGGFTTQLNADLGGTPEAKAAESPTPAAHAGGSGSGSEAASASAAPPAAGSGSAIAAVTPTPPVGSAGSSLVPAGSGSALVGSAAAPSAAGSGSGGSGSSDQPASPTPPSEPSTHHGPVKVSPELAAIKLDLEPNWDRDSVDAGTFSFVLKVPNSATTRTFVFHYGYDDAKAPSGCDEYSKWFGTAQHFTVSVARQRGGSCYVEGLDSAAVPSFRYHVLYGGKPLTCWGPQYKDAADNPLGDLRDKVVMSGKKICETLAL